MHQGGSCSPQCNNYICTQQIEIEIKPGKSEVYFQDEQYISPVDSQIQFTAIVYNAPTNKVKWLVYDLYGNPGAGKINSAGLYIAPLKDLHPSALTEVIVAYPEDDPSRRAVAFVTLIGNGPEPKPDATIEIFPKTVTLYYRNNHLDNNYIDDSNKAQLFRAIVRNSSTTSVTWSISPNAGSIDTNGLYTADNNVGGIKSIKVTAELTLQIKADAMIMLVNYSWPGII